MLHWLAAIWMGALGGCLGSFLNVIAYRLPRGMSIVAPGSRCPHCRRPIRWYHNIPIAGWLILRGRCADCGSRIAVRYPLVEAATAAVFLVAWVTEPAPAANGWHPGDPPPPASYLIRVAVAAYHGLLVTWLFGYWLTERETRHAALRVFPRSLAVGGVICGPLLYGTATAAWQVAAIDDVLLPWIVNPSVAGLVRRGLAMLVAGVLAGAAWPALACGPLGRHGRLAGAAGLLVVGGFTRPTVAVLAAVATAAVLFVAACGSRWLGRPGRPSWTTGLLGIMLAWLVARAEMMPPLSGACEIVGPSALVGGAVLATGVLSATAAAISGKRTAA